MPQYGRDRHNDKKTEKPGKDTATQSATAENASRERSKLWEK